MCSAEQNIEKITIILIKNIQIQDKFQILE